MSGARSRLIAGLALALALVALVVAIWAAASLRPDPAKARRFDAAASVLAAVNLFEADVAIARQSHPWDARETASSGALATELAARLRAIRAANDALDGVARDRVVLETGEGLAGLGTQLEILRSSGRLIEESILYFQANGMSAAEGEPAKTFTTYIYDDPLTDDSDRIGKSVSETATALRDLLTPLVAADRK